MYICTYIYVCNLFFLVFIKSHNAEAYEFLRASEQVTAIHALQPKKAIGTLELLSADVSDIPSGCVVNNPNNDSYSAFLLVQGLIDIGQEVEKVNTRLEAKRTQQGKLIANRERESYLTNATDYQKETDAKKLQETADDIGMLQAVLENLLRLQ